MADKNELSGALSGASSELEKIIQQAKAAKAAMDAKTEFKGKVSVEGTEEAAKAVEASADRQVAALQKVEEQALKTAQAVAGTGLPETA